jgi:hypothetical protein
LEEEEKREAEEERRKREEKKRKLEELQHKLEEEKCKLEEELKQKREELQHKSEERKQREEEERKQREEEEEALFRGILPKKHSEEAIISPADKIETNLQTKNQVEIHEDTPPPDADAPLKPDPNSDLYVKLKFKRNANKTHCSS